LVYAAAFAFLLLHFPLLFTLCFDASLHGHILALLSLQQQATLEWLKELVFAAEAQPDCVPTRGREALQEELEVAQGG
jgi:hypothetical protein